MKHLLAALVIAVLASLFVPEARAAARFTAEVDGAVVVLHDEKCTLTDAVSNLPLRATWLEAGKVVEGCWGPPHPQVGVVMFYFGKDKTVFGIPAPVFERVAPPI